MRDRIDLQAMKVASRHAQQQARRHTLVWVVGLLLMVGLTMGMMVIGVDNRLPTLIGSLGPLLALGIISLLLPLGVLGLSAKRFSAQREKLHGVVQRSVPGLPESKRAAPFTWPRVALLLLLLLAIPLTSILLAGPLVTLLATAKRWVPGIPDNIISMGVGIFFGSCVVLVVRAIRRMRRRPEEGEPLPPLWRDLGGYLLQLVSLLAIIGLTQRFLSAVSALIKDPLLMLFVTIVGGLGLAMLLPLFFSLAPTLWVYYALKRADYATALQRVQTLHRLWPKAPEHLFMEGTILDYSGAHGAAEALLRDTLHEENKGLPGTQVVTLENLGCALMGQKRYAEAITALEGSIEGDPSRGGPYSSLAEVYLRQGLEPARALTLSEQALTLKGASLLGRLVDRYRFGEMWGNKAWAYALLQEPERADAALATAFQVADKRFKPEMAGLHYRAGEIMARRGQADAAREHFHHALGYDEVGKYALLAREALARLG